MSTPPFLPINQKNDREKMLIVNISDIKDTHKSNRPGKGNYNCFQLHRGPKSTQEPPVSSQAR